MHLEDAQSEIEFSRGEPEAKKALREEILDRGEAAHSGDRQIEKVLFANDEWFDLNSNAYLDKERAPSAIKAEIERLQALLDAG